VTITTVGYGDITPHTPLGRILASILILIGYSIIAIPTGLITTHMTSALNRRRQRACVRSVSRATMTITPGFVTPAACVAEVNSA
jgi:voltage-gated potassium channel Kch